jgi:hypothetical protein
MLPMIALRTLLVIASALLLGCGTATTETTVLTVNQVRASAKITAISVNEATGAHFVHAMLVIEDKGKKLKSLNLSCFALKIKGVLSDEINVDSVASVLANPYPADANGRVRVPVYWVFFASKAVDQHSLPSAELVEKLETSSCFNY